MTQGLPHTYRTIRWADDMDASGAETASDYESLQQDVMHVIVEKLASNLADPTKGGDALSYLNGTSVQLGKLGSILDQQIGDMDRISNVQTTLAQAGDGSFTITVNMVVAGKVVILGFGVGPSGVTVLP